MADAAKDGVSDSGRVPVSAAAEEEVTGGLRQEEGAPEERVLPAAGPGDALLAVAEEGDLLRFLRSQRRRGELSGGRCSERACRYALCSSGILTGMCSDSSPCM